MDVTVSKVTVALACPFSNGSSLCFEDDEVTSTGVTPEGLALSQIIDKRESSCTTVPLHVHAYSPGKSGRGVTDSCAFLFVVLGDALSLPVLDRGSWRESRWPSTHDGSCNAGGVVAWKTPGRVWLVRCESKEAQRCSRLLRMGRGPCAVLSSGHDLFTNGLWGSVDAQLLWVSCAHTLRCFAV